MTHNLFFAEKLKFGRFRYQLETLKISFWSDISFARKSRLKSRNRSVSEDIPNFWKHGNEFVTSEESLQVSSLTYGLSEFYSICLGFFKMEYENDDTTDIPEIDLNICVAVQPYQFEPLDRDSSSGTGSDSASAESDEECSRPSVKSSKQIIVRCEYSLNWKHYMVRTVRTFDISCRYIALWTFRRWMETLPNSKILSLDLSSSEFLMLL